MAGIKKAKKPKTPKKVRLPKQAIRNLSNRDARRITRRYMKSVKKRKKSRDRAMNIMLGAAAVVLCAVSSVLDIIIAKKGK